MASETFSLILNLGSLAALALSAIGYVRRDAQKERDQERNFQHLTRNYDQMQESLKLLLREQQDGIGTTLDNQEILKKLEREIEALNRSLIAQNGALGAALDRINYVASRMDGGWGRSPH